MGQYVSGAISEGTLKIEDLLERFALALERLGQSTEVTSKARDLVAVGSGWSEEQVEEAEELLDALTESLEALAPDHMYFGSHPGDGACYGFWPEEAE